jgi:glucose/arabinose dehydrogenase
MIRMIRTLAIIVALAQIALQTLGAQAPFSLRVLASGLGAPWEVRWGPDDQLWVTERTGRR